MKALSILPYYAMQILMGNKTVECRTWKTDYRGDIVICSTNKKFHGTIPGHALGVVRLVDVVPFEKKHLESAMMSKSAFAPGMYAWLLDYYRFIVPQPVKGKLSLWEYTGKIEYAPEEEWGIPKNWYPGDFPDDYDVDAQDAWLEKYWTPITI